MQTNHGKVGASVLECVHSDHLLGTRSKAVNVVKTISEIQFRTDNVNTGRLETAQLQHQNKAYLEKHSDTPSPIHVIDIKVPPDICLVMSSVCSSDFQERKK